MHQRGDCSLRHAVGPGAAAGLQVILKPARLSEFLPPHPTFPPGLHIQVHNPFEFPDGRNNLFAQDRVPKVATIKVSPAFTESGGRRLRQVRPSLRNCFFNGEVPLTVYGGYSQSTCMLECRLHHTVNVCSCEPYLFRTMRSEARVMGGVGSKHLLQCMQSCLPACTGIIYDVDSVFAEAGKPVEDGDQGYMAIYYSQRAAVKYVRTPAVDELQLLVSLGGIAGLFLGVSLLSVVEVLCLALKLLLDLIATQVTMRQSGHHSPERIVRETTHGGSMAKHQSAYGVFMSFSSSGGGQRTASSGQQPSTT
ncbi:pickpocket protein 28-like [Schistocerca serialis cubense]|uniref:pickpocket protein 28-like n=1 Tax=Schistocerca serialis cubense TaxID=2023355 RepID=UPI00214E2097|nr:pickpocket protein 28-like [Schistocerca serialis cubense]